jgi:transposase-like protein
LDFFAGDPMRRQRYSAQQWATWFDEFERGDFTVAGFCQLKGVSSNAFYQWRKRLAQSASAADFVAVEVPRPALVEIDLPGGATMRVPNDAAALRPVLEVLCQLDSDR